MKIQIGNRIPRPQNNEDMRVAIWEEWDGITADDLDSLLSGMPNRVQAVFSADASARNTPFTTSAKNQTCILDI